MIIIAGPGRSGTSMFARLLVECGLDIGGDVTWNKEADAGLESAEVVATNYAIANDLGISVAGYPRPHSVAGGLPSRILKPILPDRAYSRVQALRRFLPSRPDRELYTMDWRRLDSVVDRFRGDLNGLSERRQIAKDPLFTWTLPVWLAANARIEGVILCTRDVDEIVRSRISSGLHAYANDDIARDTTIYGMGLALASLIKYRVPWEIVVYPDVLEEADTLLYQRLPLPDHVDLAAFIQARQRVRQAHRDRTHEQGSSQGKT